MGGNQQEDLGKDVNLTTHNEGRSGSQELEAQGKTKLGFLNEYVSTWVLLRLFHNTTGHETFQWREADTQGLKYRISSGSGAAGSR